jgi:hypothetical protein
MQSPNQKKELTGFIYENILEQLPDLSFPYFLIEKIKPRKIAGLKNIDN